MGEYYCQEPVELDPKLQEIRFDGKKLKLQKINM